MKTLGQDTTGGCAGCHACDAGSASAPGVRLGGSGHAPTVLLAGNPNAGKTTLFNALSGAGARVGNYPGITVERRSARVPLPGGTEIDLVDLPGTYSLTARSPEEQVAADAVLCRDGQRPDLVIVMLDATALSRGLYLALQVLEGGVPVVLGLNMMDEVERAGERIDAATLALELGIPVVPMAAGKGLGVRRLCEAIEQTLGEPPADTPIMPLPAAAAADVNEMHGEVAGALPDVPVEAHRAWAKWLLLSIGDDELEGVPEVLRQTAQRIQARAAAAGRGLDLEIVGAAYSQIDAMVERLIHRDGPPRRSVTDRLDGALTHPVWGFATFAAVLLLMFEALFTWAEPAMGAVETGVALAQGIAQAVVPAGLLQDLVVEGVIQGVGNVLVFVPQIALLFLFITALEDCGYLARVAFVIDPVMSGLGLHGKAFVPLFSGFACAVPAVMATRTIENRRDRLVTMMALPLMSCSARLPVYVLVISTVFAGQGRLLGVVSMGAAALMAMYLLSVLATLAAAAILRRTVLQGERPALVLELPPYRLPNLRTLLRATTQQVTTFLKDAGTIILALTVVMWVLLSFPHSDAIDRDIADATTAATSIEDEGQRTLRLAEIGRMEAAGQLEYSVAGRLGKAMEPAMAQLGLDWRMGVGVLGAFAAREVFVSTLALVFGTEEGQGLRDALGNARRDDGSKLMTPLTGLTLMIFFVLACQCMSTLAIVRRESGSWRWPVLMFSYMSALAYGVAWVVFQTGSALGFA